MHAGAQPGGKPRIPGDHKRYAPRMAEFRDFLRQGGPVGRVVVPKNHAGAKIPGQAGDGRQRIRRPGMIRKIPEGRQIVFPAPLYRPAEVK